MYWYPLSREEEDRAWDQAKAQAHKYRNSDAADPAKFVGNAGEIAVNEFFKTFAPENTFEYMNSEAIENAEPEFNNCDFTLQRLKIDVKTTVDIRKFSPIHSYESDDEGIPLGPAEEGFPSVNPADDTDVFIFVLLNKPEIPAPVPSDPAEAAGWANTHEHTGDYIASILGWMFADEFEGEAIGNFIQMDGNFTRLQTRDLYELLLRSGIAPK
jgi:hypothetical protein